MKVSIYLKVQTSSVSSIRVILFIQLKLPKAANEQISSWKEGQNKMMYECYT